MRFCFSRNTTSVHANTFDHAERILSLAAQQQEPRSNEDERSESNGTPSRQTLTSRYEEAMKNHRSYFDAVDLTSRPIAPFINRSKFPRVLRQRYLDRLVGQHLALAACTANPCMPPQEVAADGNLVTEIIDYAKQQESELFSRCSNQAQVYQNLAARESALDYVLGGDARRGQLDAYKAILVAGRQWDKTIDSKKRNTASGNGSEEQLMMEKQRKVKVKVKTPAELLEADLNWDVNPIETRKKGLSDDDRKYIKQQVIKNLESQNEWALLSIEERIQYVDKYMGKIFSELGAAGLVGSSNALKWQQAVEELVKSVLHRQRVDKYQQGTI